MQSKHYLKWLKYFQVHLEFLYQNILNRVPEEEVHKHDFNKFCIMMYKKSSKMIPSY